MGVGGQNVKVDINRQLAFAYLTNGLKAGIGQHTITFKRLEAAVYKCLQSNSDNDNILF